ncbi:hypothetical protein E4U38_000751 [Claviceps purpurea]|nr:hypothetical protein E4U38_000751 [Claviceps purpurea]
MALGGLRVARGTKRMRLVRIMTINEYDGEQVGAMVAGELKMYDAGRLGFDSCQT